MDSFVVYLPLVAEARSAVVAPVEMNKSGIGIRTFGRAAPHRASDGEQILGKEESYNWDV